MPWRISASARTLTVWRFSTPQAFSICTAALEKPHCGNCGVPFMYSTTGWLVTCSRMVSWVLIGGFRKSRRIAGYGLYRNGGGSTKFNLRAAGAVAGSFLDCAGEPGNVVLDEKRIEDGDRKRAKQRARHQRAPVVHVALHQLGHHAHRNGLDFG